MKDAIPLFPLHAVLYPQCTMSLRIFEPRYLDMISEQMKNNAGFGVCQIKEGSETGTAAACFNIGAYAQIIDFSRRADGLLNVVVTGKRRFRVRCARMRDNNLLEGEVDWLAETGETEDAGQYPLLRDIYLHLVENYETPYQAEDHAAIRAATLSYRLAEFLPFDGAVKQEILQTDATAERMELISTNLLETEIGFDLKKRNTPLQ